MRFLNRKNKSISGSQPPLKKEKEMIFINVVPVIPSDNSIDVTELHNIFTGKRIDAADLRSSGWQRKVMMKRIS